MTFKTNKNPQLFFDFVGEVTHFQFFAAILRQEMCSGNYIAQSFGCSSWSYQLGKPSEAKTSIAVLVILVFVKHREKSLFESCGPVKVVHC